MPLTRPLKTLALISASVLVLAACGNGQTGSGTDPGTSDAATVEITDNDGTKTIPSPPQSVVSTDNRTFETLSDWGITLKAAPVPLIPTTLPYKEDASIIDLGSHNEPNLEAVVEAQPDLIINGQRFAQYKADFERLAPDAVVVDLDPREGEPLDAELKRQTTVLGEIFDKQSEAEALSKELDDSIARVKAAYDPADTVMAVNVSGGNIGYLAPSVGRTLGPVFDFANLTPALQVEGSSDDHQGDDISVEAIAQSNPTWILVMDRDAAISAAQEAGYTPAAQVIENSQALAGVTAIQEGNVIYLPADTYTNEGIQTYTEFLNSFADALEQKN